MLKVCIIQVCVNYADFLAITLPCNIQYAKDMVVVTSCLDVPTQELCKQHGVNIILSESYKPVFNKAKMLNEGLRYMYDKHPGDWYLCMDADTLIRQHRPVTLESGKGIAYGARRLLVENPGCRPVLDSTNCEWPGAMMCYFQLFDKMNVFYDETYETAQCCDDQFFFKNFNCNVAVTFDQDELVCYHFGEIAKNWTGRVTPRW